MFLRILGVLATAMAAIVAPARAYAAPAAEASSAEAATAPVVIVGFSGVTWADISREGTPNLYALAEDAGAANIVTRTVEETTCAGNGWLTLATGQRATGACGTDPRAAWASVTSANAASAYKASLGTLGEAVEAASIETVAYGEGAALALTTSDGELPSTVRYTPSPADSAGRGAENAAAAASVVKDAGSARLVVVDLGSATYPESPAVTGIRGRLQATFTGLGKTPASVTSQIRAIDAAVGSVVNEVESRLPGAHVIVTSVGDSQSRIAQLGYFAVSSNGRGVATSDATRQDGLVQLTDILPTVQAELGIEPAAAEVGSPITVSTHRAWTSLADDARRSESVRPYIGPFYLALIVGLAAVVLLHVARRRSPASTQLALVVAAMPVSSLLANMVPWWRSGSPGGTLAATIVMFAALIAFAAQRLPERHAPLTVIGVVSAATLILDVVLDRFIPGYPLQLASLLGSQPQVGGRFYGLSNGSFAVLAAGLVLALSVLRPTKASAIGVGAAAAAAILVDGAPGLGADFGGPPVLVMSLGILVCAMLGARLRWPHAAVLAAAAAAVSFAFAYIDFLKPPARRSHLGRFIEQLHDGGAGTVIARKLEQVGFGAPWWLTLIVLAAALAGMAWALARIGFTRHLDTAQWSATRRGAVALGAGLVAGMLVNDSGVVVPLVGLAVALPAWLADADTQGSLPPAR